MSTDVHSLFKWKDHSLVSLTYMVYNQYNDFSFHLILIEQLNMMQVLHLFYRYIMIPSQILNDVDHVDDLPYKTKIIKIKTK